MCVCLNALNQGQRLGCCLIFYKPTYTSLASNTMNISLPFHFYINKSKSETIAISREQIRKIFEQHDINHDGCLSLEELKTAFGELGSRFPSCRAHLSLWSVDANGDGKINPQETEALINYAMSMGYRVK